MLIKKSIFLFAICLCGICSRSYAQTNMVHYDEHSYPLFLCMDNHYYGGDSIDCTILRVDYLSSIMVDTMQHVIVEQMSTLEIGRSVSRFCLTDYIDVNSTLLSGRTESLFRKGVTYPQSFYEMYFQNYPQKGLLTGTGRVYNTDFKYEEDLPEMKWTISDSTDNILGYQVQMALCHFRGRDYVAWFTSLIPVSAGPWKFSGLPGLILKVEDTGKQYSFTAQGVYQTSGSLEIPKYLYLKTTRQKYMKAVHLSFTERFKAATLYLKGILLRPQPGTPLSREMLHDFLERE